MNIAIDVSPLQSGHKVRGVGFYLHNLKESLNRFYPDINYTFFHEKKELQGNIDLVHFPYFDPYFLTLPLIKKFKTVVTVHDLTPIIFPKHFPAGLKGSLRWQVQKRLLQQVDAVITDSESSKRDVVRHTGLPEGKIHVVYLAAGEEFKSYEQSNVSQDLLLKKYKLPDKFVLYVGDATWNKNLVNLVKAVKQTKLPLVMVGKAISDYDIDKENPWNSDLVVVQKLVRDNEQFVIAGFVPTEDLVALYNLAQVAIMPSRYEGFGLPVLEAMQSGCPVITTTRGSLAEVAGDAAYFTDPESVESIKDSIESVVSNKKLQKILSEKGIAQAKKFSWKKTADQTVSVYKEILS